VEIKAGDVDARTYDGEHEFEIAASKGFRTFDMGKPTMAGFDEFE